MEDVSKTTIAVLLVLVVLISVIGTWVVLNSIISIQQQPLTQITQTQAQGNLKLAILEQPQPSKSTSSQGNVMLTVLKPGEKEEV